MALTPEERKKLLGHGGLARARRRARRTAGHMTHVNNGVRRDALAEKWITRIIVEANPAVDPTTVFPPMPAVQQSA